VGGGNWFVLALYALLNTACTRLMGVCATYDTFVKQPPIPGWFLLKRQVMLEEAFTDFTGRCTFKFGSLQRICPGFVREFNGMLNRLVLQIVAHG